MRTVSMIDNEIKKLEEELNRIQGTETEVYSRIVGYYRAVKNWNRGKTEEYYNRKTYVKPNGNEPGVDASTVTHPVLTEENPMVKERSPSEMDNSAASFAFFFNKDCRNCHPLKDEVMNLGMRGKVVDLDTEGALDEAKKYAVYSTPTVIFFDRNKQPVRRVHSHHELMIALAEMSIPDAAAATL